MSFYRSMWLGVVGALLALGAVPNTAHAAASVFAVYSDWLSSTAGPTTEITVLCSVQPSAPNCPGLGNPQPDSPYPQVPAGTGTADQSIPLTTAGSPLISLTVKSEGVSGNPPSNCQGSCPLYRNKVSDTNPYNNGAWSTFWPKDLATNATYTGDVWTTNCTNPATGTCSTGSQTNPVTSLVLVLSSPLNSFGFVALPVDSSQYYDVTATFKNGLTTEGAITEVVLDGSTACSATSTNAANTVETTPVPCGFFGYTGGGLAGADITTINLTMTADTSQCTNLSGLKNAPAVIGGCGTTNGGIGIGDFVSSAIPEPASLAILGIGLIGLGVTRRRRASHAA